MMMLCGYIDSDVCSGMQRQDSWGDMDSARVCVGEWLFEYC